MLRNIEMGGGGGVTKYFDVSSEEKTVNDQDFDTDCSSDTTI